MTTCHLRQIYALLLCGLSTAAVAECTLTKEFAFPHAEIGTVQVFRDASSKAIAFASQMQVNTDGAPDSYRPDDTGITHICNGVSLGQACTWKANCLPKRVLGSGLTFDAQTNSGVLHRARRNKRVGWNETPNPTCHDTLEINTGISSSPKSTNRKEK